MIKAADSWKLISRICSILMLQVTDERRSITNYCLSFFPRNNILNILILVFHRRLVVSEGRDIKATGLCCQIPITVALFYSRIMCNNQFIHIHKSVLTFCYLPLKRKCFCFVCFFFVTFFSWPNSANHL